MCPALHNRQKLALQKQGQRTQRHFKRVYAGRAVSTPWYVLRNTSNNFRKGIPQNWIPNLIIFTRVFSATQRSRVLHSRYSGIRSTPILQQPPTPMIGV